MSQKKNKPLSRREILQLLGIGSVAAPFVGGLHPGLQWLSPTAQAMGSEPHRFLQIFLVGGWDSHLATDPILSGSGKETVQIAKQNNGQGIVGYPSLTNNGAFPVGKTELKVGPGLFNALPAFQALPTAFINGIFVEVTAHELAQNYMLSGQLSLSRSREFPAFIATMGANTNSFPPHVVLGQNIPLGDTKAGSPPLQSINMDMFRNILSGPKSSAAMSPLSDVSIGAADSLIAKMNTSFQKRLGKAAKDSLKAWDNAEGKLASFYAQNFQDQIIFSDTVQNNYGFDNDDGNTTPSTGQDAGSMQAKMAASFLALKSGISRFVTCNFGDFDTHRGHLAPHLEMMNSFGTALTQLVTDLQATDDPDMPTKKLSETTTILITSEFVRTPHLNQSAGTDHWQSGSAILMGKGIQDRMIVGATDDDANAVNYNGDKLLPDHVASSILRRLGFTTEADELTTEYLSALFS